MKNKRTNYIEVTIETIRIVTIVELQSLRSSSREFGGILGKYYYPSQQDCSSTGFKNPEVSLEETVMGF